MRGKFSRLILPTTTGIRPLLPLAMILAVAVGIRSWFLLRYPGLPTDPDLDSYLTIAATRSGWNTLYREPLYIWLLQVMHMLSGSLTIRTAQLTAVLMSTCAVSALYLLCWKRLNLTVAIVASLLYACVPYIAQLSARGLREDAIVFTTLVFIHLAWSHWEGRLSWKTLTVLGLAGAACALLRVSSLSFVVLVILLVAAYRFWQGSRGWKITLRWLYPIGLVIALTIPYLLNCKREYGQTFFLANFAARYYANQEFAGNHPDFPTLEEIQRDAYAGPVITPRQYIFKYHSLPQIARQSSVGFLKVFLGLLPRVQAYFVNHIPTAILFFLVHLAGIAWLLHPRRLFFPLAIFLFHAPLFFLAGSPAFDPRLLILGIVFVLVSLSCSAALLLRQTRSLLSAPSAATEEL